MKELKKHLSDYEKAGNLFAEINDKMKIGLNNSKWCYDQCEAQLKNGTPLHDLSAYCNDHLLVNYLHGLI